MGSVSVLASLSPGDPEWLMNFKVNLLRDEREAKALHGEWHAHSSRMVNSQRCQRIARRQQMCGSRFLKHVLSVVLCDLRLLY